MPVSINRRGQFVGHNGTELQSYLGVLARQNVPISFPSWPKVSRELKDKIWEQAQVRKNDYFVYLFITGIRRKKNHAYVLVWSVIC